MSVYNNEAWFKCSKKIINDQNLSQSAKWLYVVLSCLNNNYGSNTGKFTRTNDELVKDSGIKITTLKKAKKELIDAGYIKVSRANLIDLSAKKRTSFSVCEYDLI